MSHYCWPDMSGRKSSINTENSNSKIAIRVDFNRIIALCAMFTFSSVPVNSQELVDKGRDIAAKHCTRCHVVADINPRGGISSTPSFQLMVKALRDWEERFETFYVRHPHPAIIRIEEFDYDEAAFPPATVPILLKLDDIGALLAFAKTLEKQQ